MHFEVYHGVDDVETKGADGQGECVKSSRRGQKGLPHGGCELEEQKFEVTALDVRLYSPRTQSTYS
jgi:hypothetical protein